MSHSQFHSTNLFILRHAWLNLWDKHMTTGRINQVTTFQFTNYSAAQSSATFIRQEFIFSDSKIFSQSPVINNQEINKKSTLFPGLTSSRSNASCHRVTTRIMLFSENCLQSAKQMNARSRRILNCSNHNKTGHQQVVHIFPLGPSQADLTPWL